MLALRRGVTFALVVDRLVFLDVPADRYFCLTVDLDDSIKRIIAGDPNVAPESLAALRAAGVVIDGVGDAIAPTNHPTAPASSLLDSVRRPPPTAVLHASTRLWASMARLKTRSFEHNLEQARRLRRHARAPSCDGLADLAAAFDRASTWTSSHDRCLAQSLAVARAARSAGHDVDVVIGVALGPFLAHCWVQQGPVIVNDRVETVRRFTPILVF